MNENNTSKYVIGIVALVVLAVGTVVLMQKKSEAQPVDNNASADMAAGSNTATFSGTISAVDTGCTSDGICSVTIDGKKVILAQYGGPAPTAPVGKLIGVDSISDIQGKIGAFANVFAGKTAEGDYTLYGNSAYYVEVAEISDK
ncbi:MAG TPA: hypothetical protein VK675_00345 [Candidatus Paceibacterota bacterium]|nr:hypothetical protein [Candidatus Paceibacterota bacterium]